jgi:hypothetical protein
MKNHSARCTSYGSTIERSNVNISRSERKECRLHEQRDLIAVAGCWGYFPGSPELAALVFWK